VGASDKTVSILRRLYLSDTFQLLLDGVPGTAIFAVVTGVHEGSCLSPLLFIFFIRDLPATVNLTPGIDAPDILGSNTSTLVYADDVAEMSLTLRGLQLEIDVTVDFFDQRELEVNPEKSEVICFCRPRAVNPGFECSFGGVTRGSVEAVRYLGVHFDARGNWKLQKQLIVARSRAALGRCKVVVNTIGRGNVKQAINLFDTLVGSVYRFALGAWGPTAGKLCELDNLFVKFITWVYRLPTTTCKSALMACFGRRCTECDALFLASIQVARGSGSDGGLWGSLVQELKTGKKKSKWFMRVRKALEDRGLRELVWDRPTEAVSERHSLGLRFSQFCFHKHLNLPRGTSADQFRTIQPFGVFPFLYHAPPFLARFLLSFVVSNWRWIDGGACKNHPRSCHFCGVHNSSVHVLFECPIFEGSRREFYNKTGVTFDFEAMMCNSREVAREAAVTGKNIFSKIAATFV
jgi:hypothetical protein